MEILGEINGIPFGEEIYFCGRPDGNRIDIYHDSLADYLKRYRVYAKAVVGPLGDNQRREFEIYMERIIYAARQKYIKKNRLPHQSKSE